MEHEIQVGDGRGRRQFVKPKTSEVKPFWINADGSIELEEAPADHPVLEMLQDHDIEKAQAYADRFTKQNKIPCPGCSGKGTVVVVTFDSMAGHTDHRNGQDRTCKMCNGTGIKPDDE